MLVASPDLVTPDSIQRAFAGRNTGQGPNPRRYERPATDEDDRSIAAFLPPPEPISLADITPLPAGTCFFTLDPAGIALLGTDATDVFWHIVHGEQVPSLDSIEARTLQAELLGRQLAQMALEDVPNTARPLSLLTRPPPNRPRRRTTLSPPQPSHRPLNPRSRQRRSIPHTCAKQPLHKFTS